MPHSDELLDLVDDQDRVMGQARRSEIYRAGWVNFRVVNALGINPRLKRFAADGTATGRARRLKAVVCTTAAARAAKARAKAAAMEIKNMNGYHATSK